MNKASIITPFLMAVAFSANAKQPLGYYAERAGEAVAIGRYEDGLDYARQEIADYPDNPKGYFEAALSLWGLNEFGQAVSMTNKAIDLSNKDKAIAADSRLLKGELLKLIGDTVQAIQTLEQGIKADSKNCDLLTAHARLIGKKEAKRALKQLDKAKKLCPDDPRPYAFSSEIYDLQGNLQAGVNEIDQAILRDPNNGRNHIIRGFLLKRMGKAPEWYQACLRGEALTEEIGAGASILADTESAVERYEIIKLIERERDKNPLFYKLQASLLIDWSDIDKAVEVLKESIAAGYDEDIIYYQLAELQKEQGQLLDSYSTVSAGLDKYPGESNLMFLKAQIGNQVGKAKDILGILDRLISENPENAEIYYEKGTALMNLGKYNEAVNPFSIAYSIALSPTYQLMQADALRLAGRGGEANNLYRQLLTLTNSTAGAENYNIPLLYALAYSGLGDKMNALKNVDECEGKTAFLPEVYARLQDSENTLRAISDYLNKSDDVALFDYLGYDFHFLHSSPEFTELLREHGLPTERNETTGLLEALWFEPTKTMGGTSLESLESLKTSGIRDWSDFIEAFNGMCPIDLGALGQITGVEYYPIPNEFTMNLLTAPGMMNYDALARNPSYRQKKEDVLLLSLISSSPKIATGDVTIVYKLRGADNSGHMEFKVTPEKLRRLKKLNTSQDEFDRLCLDLWYEEDKMTFESGIMGNAEVTYNGKTFTTVIHVPNDQAAIAGIELFKDDYKKEMLKQFEDPTARSRTDVFIRQGISLKYIYKDDSSGKTVEILLTPEDFKSVSK